MTAEPFVARVSVAKVAGVLACCMIFVIAGIWLIVHAGASDRAPPAMAYVTGALAIAFGTMSALSIGSLLDLDRPLVEIGPEGLLWRHWSEQRIPWGAIRHGRIRRHAAQSAITFSLYDPGRYPPRALRSPVARLSRGLGFGDITFSSQASDRSFETTLEAIRRFAPELTLH